MLIKDVHTRPYYESNWNILQIWVQNKSNDKLKKKYKNPNIEEGWRKKTKNSVYLSLIVWVQKQRI